MKSRVTIVLMVVLLVASCSNEAPVDSQNSVAEVLADTGFVVLDTADMQTISLVEHQLNLSLKLPVVATATGLEIKPQVKHTEGDYLWYINIGEHFTLVIEDYAKEFNKVQQHKEQLKAQQDLFKISYLEEAPHLIFYKRELVDNNGGLPTFHCYAEITIDGYNYVMRTKTFGGYEPVVRDIVASIKTAKPIFVKSENNS